MTGPKIEISEDAYNEVALAFNKHGLRLGENTIEIAKGTNIVPPYNLTLVQVRRDCANIVAQYYKFDVGVIEEIEKLYRYVLTGKVPTKQEKE